MPKDRPLPDHAQLVPRNAKKVFSGEIFEVYQWRQKMFDGTEEIFEMLKRADTVNVIGVIGDKVILLRQRQPNTNEFWSLPGGRVDPGEDIYSCAKRETLEETGIEFKDWKLVHVKQIAHKIEAFNYTFVATNPIRETTQKLDAGERITVHKIPYSRLLAMVRSSENEVGHVDYLRDKLIQGKDKLADILNDKEIR